MAHVIRLRRSDALNRPIRSFHAQETRARSRHHELNARGKRKGIEPVAVGTGAYASADPQWRETYGLSESGAVLVRPDGHIGWRSAEMTGDPARTLGDAMNAIHGMA